VLEFPVTDSLIFLKFGIDLGFGSSRGSFGYSFIHWITGDENHNAPSRGSTST